VIKKKVSHTKGDDEEEKDCCDELESPIDGSLPFLIGNAQVVRMQGNMLKISIKKDNEWIDEEFYFDVDIQSTFCELDEGNVTSIIEQNAVTDSNHETTDISSLGFSGPTEDVEGFDPHYGFRFMKSVMFDDEITEIQVSIKVDKVTCEASVSVLFDDEIFEGGGNPLYSSDAFNQQLELLGNATSSYYWNRLLFLWSEHFKHDDSAPLRTEIRQKIGEGLTALYQNNKIDYNEYLNFINALNNSSEIEDIPNLLGEIVSEL